VRVYRYSPAGWNRAGGFLEYGMYAHGLAADIFVIVGAGYNKEYTPCQVSYCGTTNTKDGLMSPRCPAMSAQYTSRKPFVT
jgi:hypothetical protein